jgi:HEAT repeat protein
MVAMAEELGVEMAIRSLEHLLQYGEQNIRRAVPLALGLLCISNPKVFILLALAEYPLVRSIQSFYKAAVLPFSFGKE